MKKVLKVKEDFNKLFRPDLTPKQMLKLGVFGGYYFEVKTKDIPEDIMKLANISKREGKEKKDKKLNYFKVSASQPRSVWQEKGWINKADPNGWFEWYIKYFYGRRLRGEDERQIKRWLAIRRHIGGIVHNCQVGDIFCRPRQRQALLHWAYDSRKL